MNIYHVWVAKSGKESILLLLIEMYEYDAYRIINQKNNDRL